MANLNAAREEKAARNAEALIAEPYWKGHEPKCRYSQNPVLQCDCGVAAEQLEAAHREYLTITEVPQVTIAAPKSQIYIQNHTPAVTEQNTTVDMPMPAHHGRIVVGFNHSGGTTRIALTPADAIQLAQCILMGLAQVNR